MQWHRLTRHDFRLGHCRFHVKAQARLQDAIKLPVFLVDHGISGQRGEAAAQRQQRGHAGGGILRVVLRGDLASQAADLGPAGHAVPSGVDAVEDVLARRIAVEKFEGFQPWSATAAVGETAHTLGLVHRAAVRRDFCKQLPGHRVAASDVELQGALRNRAAGAAAEAILENAPGLPGRQGAELFRKRLGIAGELEGLQGQDGRCRVVTVGAARLRREAGDEHVRPKLADDTHDVSQHLLVVPLGERLAVVLRVAEVTGPGEKLSAAVDAPGGEQFLGADHPQFVAKFGTEQVLAAVAPV